MLSLLIKLVYFNRLARGIGLYQYFKILKHEGSRIKYLVMTILF